MDKRDAEILIKAIRNQTSKAVTDAQRAARDNTDDIVEREGLLRVTSEYVAGNKSYVYDGSFEYSDVFGSPKYWDFDGSRGFVMSFAHQPDDSRCSFVESENGKPDETDALLLPKVYGTNLPVYLINAQTDNGTTFSGSTFTGGHSETIHDSTRFLLVQPLITGDEYSTSFSVSQITSGQVVEGNSLYAFRFCAKPYSGYIDESTFVTNGLFAVSDMYETANSSSPFVPVTSTEQEVHLQLIPSVRFYDDEGYLISEYVGETVPMTDDTWTEESYAFFTPAGTCSVSIVFSAETSCDSDPGCFLLDEVYMFPKQRGSITVQGEDFDSYFESLDESIGEISQSATNVPSAPTWVTLSYDFSSISSGWSPSLFLEVGFGYPTTNTDGSILTDLAGVEVLWTDDGGEHWWNNSGLVSAIGEASSGATKIVGSLKNNTFYQVKVCAVDGNGNKSDYVLSDIVQPIFVVTVPDAVDVTATSGVNSILVSASLPVGFQYSDAFYGYIVEYSASVQDYSDGGSPQTWQDWSEGYVFPSQPDRPSKMEIIVADARKWYRARAKITLNGGWVSSNWSSVSNYTSVADLNSQIASYAGAGAVRFGDLGLIVTSGKIYLNTGTNELNTVRIDTEGIKGFNGSVAPCFSLTNSDGLVLRGGDIYLMDSGKIQLTGTSGSVGGSLSMDNTGIKVYDSSISPVPIVTIDNSGVILDHATSGIVCKNGVTEVARLNRYGLTLDSATDGIRILDNGNRVVGMSSSGVYVYSAGSNEPVVLLGKLISGYGLEVKGPSNKIVGATFATATSGVRTEFNSSYPGEMRVYNITSGYSSYNPWDYVAPSVHDVYGGVKVSQEGFSLTSIPSPTLTDTMSVSGGVFHLSMGGGLNGLLDYYTDGADRPIVFMSSIGLSSTVPIGTAAGVSLRVSNGTGYGQLEVMNGDSSSYASLISGSLQAHGQLVLHGTGSNAGLHFADHDSVNNMWWLLGDVTGGVFRLRVRDPDGVYHTLSWE